GDRNSSFGWMRIRPQQLKQKSRPYSTSEQCLPELTRDNRIKLTMSAIGWSRPLSVRPWGEKRTTRRHSTMSAFDPKRTSATSALTRKRSFSQLPRIGPPRDTVECTRPLYEGDYDDPVGNDTYSHPDRRCSLWWGTSARHRRARACSSAARRMRRLVATRCGGPAAGDGLTDTRLAPAIAFALCGGGSRHCGRARPSRYLVS